MKIEPGDIIVSSKGGKYKVLEILDDGYMRCYESPFIACELPMFFHINDIQLHGEGKWELYHGSTPDVEQRRLAVINKMKPDQKEEYYRKCKEVDEYKRRMGKLL